MSFCRRFTRARLRSRILCLGLVSAVVLFIVNKVLRMKERENILHWFDEDATNLLRVSKPSSLSEPSDKGIKAHLLQHPISLFHSCKRSVLASPKHGMALPFYIAAQRYEHRVDRLEDADIVIVPALIDWFSVGLCEGSWTNHLHNLTRAVQHVRKPMLLIANHWRSASFASKLCNIDRRFRIGRYMKVSRCDFLIGYMNDADSLNFDYLIGQAPSPRFYWDASRERKWHIEFVGQVDQRRGYRDRYRLFHANVTRPPPQIWVTTSTKSQASHVKECKGRHFQCYQWLSREGVLRLRSESNFSLMLRGDDATSDRLQNAFVVGAVPVTVDSMSWLPFGFVIPWERILYRLSGKAFWHDPIGTIDWVPDPNDLQTRQQLIERHKPDLILSHPKSRVVQNIIRASTLTTVKNDAKFNVVVAFLFFFGFCLIFSTFLFCVGVSSRRSAWYMAVPRRKLFATSTGDTV